MLSLTTNNTSIQAINLAFNITCRYQYLTKVLLNFKEALLFRALDGIDVPKERIDLCKKYVSSHFGSVYLLTYHCICLHLHGI